MIIFNRNRGNVIQILKAKEFAKSYAEISEGEIVSLNTDPLGSHSNEDNQQNLPVDIKEDNHGSN